MRTFILLAALGAAVPARADISDSGALTIGGQGVIAGSVTVRGAAGFESGITATTATFSTTTDATGLTVKNTSIGRAYIFLNSAANNPAVIQFQDADTANGAFIQWDDDGVVPLRISTNESGESISLETGVQSEALRLDGSQHAHFRGGLTIASSATVQGAEFSVGGATFSVAGGSVTLGGRLNLAASGIKWADGTTSTTATGGSGSAAAIWRSSAVINLPTGSFTNTSIGPCLSNTTVTISFAQQSCALVINSSIISNEGGSGVVGLGFLIDGAKQSPGGNDVAGQWQISGESNGSFTVLTSTLSAGSHSFCLSGRVSSGTGSRYGGGNYYNHFAVLEAPCSPQ